MRYLLILFVLVLFLAGCGANLTGKVYNPIPEEDIVMEHKYVPQAQEEVQGDLPGRVVETPDDLVQVGEELAITGAMCEGVSLGFKECERLDNKTIRLKIFNGLSQLDGLYFKLSYLDTEEYRYDGRFVDKKGFVDYEVSLDNMDEVTSLELLPAILVESEQRVCINKKIFLNPKNSCKSS